MQRIEVITGEQKRRRYTPEEKTRFVALSMQPGYSVSLVARQYGITPSLLFKWKRLMNDGGKSAIAAGEDVVSASEVKALEKKVKQLEQMLGRKTMRWKSLRTHWRSRSQKSCYRACHCCHPTISNHPSSPDITGITFKFVRAPHWETPTSRSALQ